MFVHQAQRLKILQAHNLKSRRIELKIKGRSHVGILVERTIDHGKKDCAPFRVDLIASQTCCKAFSVLFVAITARCV